MAAEAAWGRAALVDANGLAGRRPATAVHEEPSLLAGLFHLGNVVGKYVHACLVGSIDERGPGYIGIGIEFQSLHRSHQRTVKFLAAAMMPFAAEQHGRQLVDGLRFSISSHAIDFDLQGLNKHGKIDGHGETP